MITYKVCSLCHCNALKELIHLHCATTCTSRAASTVQPVLPNQLPEQHSQHQPRVAATECSNRIREQITTEDRQLNADRVRQQRLDPAVREREAAADKKYKKRPEVLARERYNIDSQA